MLMMTICWVNVCIIESYVHAFISCWVGYLYPVTMIRILYIQWRRLVPHAYRVMSRVHCIRLINGEKCHTWQCAWWICALVKLGDLYTWLFMHLVKFGDYVKMWKCTWYSIMLVYLMFINDVEFIVSDFIKCYNPLKLIMLFYFHLIIL